MASNYSKLGPSATKAGLHKALKSAGISAEDDVFAQLSPDIAGDPNYAGIIHSDGAGTKSIVAYLMFKETGDASWFAGLAQDALVMNLDDIYCLGAPERLLLSNAVGRDPKRISDDSLSELLRGYRECTERLQRLGVPLVMSGGETADMSDIIRTLVVDATLAGRIPLSKLIRTSAIVPGDIIVGLSSSGTARFETDENSGIGSNGLTLARHALLSSHYRESFPEALADNIDSSLAYRGPFRLTDLPPELDGLSIGKALLSPTRPFAPVLARCYESLGASVHGTIHVTGGGLSKVLRFGQADNRYVKDNLFACPPIFQLIQQHGGIGWREMYEVFNMGQRIELYVAPEATGDCIRIAQDFGIDAQVIGRVEQNPAGTGRTVIVDSPHGSFEYQLP